MTTVVSFVLVIGILILIHELGHFFVARWTGVGVERFSIGFGPVLLRWRGKETEYALSAIPMGGYVKMMGEENPLEGGATPDYDPAKAFALKPLWARFLIVFAGPGMNLVLAVFIFAIVLATLGRPVWPAAVGRVNEGTPAASGESWTGSLRESSTSRLTTRFASTATTRCPCPCRTLYAVRACTSIGLLIGRAPRGRVSQWNRARGRSGARDGRAASGHRVPQPRARGVFHGPRTSGPFYEAALAAGGTDKGAPGIRATFPNYYAAYVRDPDGNNIKAVCRTA